MVLGAILFHGVAQAGQEQAWGYYAKGRLMHADIFEDSGIGFVKILRSRQRGYAAMHLKKIVQNGALEMSKAYPELERLQIGDVAQEGGGKVGAHLSHQNGLDIDLVYFRRDTREQDPNLAENFDEKFVEAGEVTENFDGQRNWEILSGFVQSGHVKRIFVDQAIKRYFCSQYKSEVNSKLVFETLRRLRPLKLHDDHFHLRVDCPFGDAHCISQKDPEMSTGCGAIELLTDSLTEDDFE